MACLFGHEWNGCKCMKCGKVRDAGHSWNGCICKTCGKQTEYANFDCLDAEEIELFASIVCDYTERNIQNMTRQQANVAREFLGRLEAAARSTPFQLVKEDLKTARLYFNTAIHYGWLKTDPPSSDLEAMKAHIIQQEMKTRKAIEIDEKLEKLIQKNG